MMSNENHLSLSLSVSRYVNAFSRDQEHTLIAKGKNVNINMKREQDVKM